MTSTFLSNKTAVVTGASSGLGKAVAESGHIINVSSTSGIKARVDEPIYCASKWGLRGFTESLRMAAVAHGIRVTGVYPGGMATDF